MKRAADLLADLAKTLPDPTMVKGPACATCGDTYWKHVGPGVVRCPDCWERKRGFAPGVPTDETTTTLATWDTGSYTVTSDNRDALQQAKFFLQDVHPNLYIHGGVGTGKTALACAILNELHRVGKTVRFVRVTELLKQLVQADTGDHDYDRMVSVPVLCLDDIGAQKGNDYARQALLSIYDARTGSGRRTIWTSNLDLEELIAFMGDDARLTSRIAGTAKVVQLDGIDYRLKKARQRR
jgi:DNA replication protein DnaC